MNVSLHPQLAQFVEEQVKSGRFRSADDVVNGAVARLQAEAELSGEDTDALRAEIATGIREADAGQMDAWDADEIWSEVERRAQIGKSGGNGNQP
jgi:antitoxin ParD1/3/4